MSVELLNLRLEGLIERVEKLEDHHGRCNQPEDGTLAKIKQSVEQSIEKVESKLNWLITFILTTVVGTLLTIILAKLGFK